MINKPNSLRSGISAFGALGKSAFALAISAIFAGSAFADNVGSEADYNTDVAASAETTTTVTSSIDFTGPIAVAASSSPYTLQGVSTLTQPTLQGAVGTGPALTIATPVALIKNLEFTQFTTGAVVAADIVRLEDIRFTSNTAGGNGGAVNVVGDFGATAASSIDGAIFDTNKAGFNGGAVAVAQDFKGNIENSGFNGNEAVAGAGGAVFIGGDVDGQIDRSTFTANEADLGGGAVAVAGNFTGDVKGSTFDSNAANDDAGAIVVVGDFTGDIDTSTFNKNTAGQNAGAVGIFGDFTGNIDTSTFTANTAGESAGAVGVSGNFVGDIKASTFDSNVANDDAGAIGVFGNFTGDIDGSTFNKNVATTLFGGAIALGGNFTGDIKNSTFTDNEAQGLLSPGGALYVGGDFAGDISGANTLFGTNKASVHGGAVAIAGDFDGKIADGRFLSNEAQNGVGGAVYIGGDVGATSASSIDNATFRANEAELGGGAVAVFGNFTGDVKGSTFDANKARAATADAGAIGVIGNFTGDIDTSTFTANTAGQDAGAVGVGGNFVGDIKASTFDSNVANNDGGAIGIAGDFTGDIDGSTFNKNVATTLSGGAIGFGGSVTGDIKNSTFTDNEAKASAQGGGAFFFIGDFTGVIENSDFRGNVATERGGAIATWNGSPSAIAPDIKGSTFVGNKADGTLNTVATNGRGGAIAVNNGFTIENSTFLANEAIAGAVNWGAADGVGGAIHYNAKAATSTLTLDATAAGDRILFYGNTNQLGGTTTAVENAIHFANEKAPGTGSVVTVNITGAGDLLLLDGISSQDGVAVGRDRVEVNVTKAATETGNFYLGGRSNVRDDSTWDVDGGSLVLTTVDYGAGATSAVVDLGGATAAVNLGSGATLAGSGAINAVANGFALNGTIDPSVWENTGTLASAITNGIPAADIAAIGVAETDAVGKITLAGNTTLGATAVYNVTARTDGSAADQIEVVGDTTINAAATVVLSVEPGTWTGPTINTIVDGTAGVLSGSFDAVNSSLSTGYLFMDAALDYSTADQIDLVLTRNNLAATIGTTYNQSSIGVAIDGIEEANPIVGGIMNIATVGEALAAFDNLSGEIYSSTGTVLLQTSSHVRNLVADRLAETEATERAGGVWASIYGYTGELKGNSNTVKAELDNSFGFAVGGDLAVGQNSNVGLLLGYETADVRLAGNRSSNSDVETFNVGVYFGSSFGGIQLRSGLAHSRHDIDTSRSINSGHIVGNNSSSYDADLTQLFVDLAYPIQINEKFQLSPYAGLSQLWLDVDGARETGTVATLETYDRSMNTAISNVGLRFKSSVADKVALHGGLGWQHAFDEEDGQSRRRFWNSTGTSADFSVKGARLGEDLLTITLGLSGEIAPNRVIGVDYRGEVSSQQKQHGGQLHYSLRF